MKNQSTLTKQFLVNDFHLSASKKDGPPCPEMETWHQPKQSCLFSHTQAQSLPTVPQDVTNSIPHALQF